MPFSLLSGLRESRLGLRLFRRRFHGSCADLLSHQHRQCTDDQGDCFLFPHAMVWLLIKVVVRVVLQPLSFP